MVEVKGKFDDGLDRDHAEGRPRAIGKTADKSGDFIESGIQGMKGGKAR
jgi:hypothetical protein